MVQQDNNQTCHCAPLSIAMSSGQSWSPGYATGTITSRCIVSFSLVLRAVLFKHWCRRMKIAEFRVLLMILQEVSCSIRRDLVQKWWVVTLPFGKKMLGPVAFYHQYCHPNCRQQVIRYTQLLLHSPQQL